MPKSYRKGTAVVKTGFGVLTIIGLSVLLQCNSADQSKEDNQPDSLIDSVLVKLDDSSTTTVSTVTQVESTLVLSGSILLPNGEEWLELRPGQIADGFTLDGRGSLVHNGIKVTKPIPVSYTSDGRTLYARRAYLSPASPNGRYAFLKACDADDESGICWGLYLIDTKLRILSKTYAGKYGPENEVKWAGDGSYATFRYNSEGETHRYRIDLPSGKSINLD